MKQFDFLVLGSGIAGLTFALQVAPRGRVALITKKNRADSNTNWAQGGIAAVTSKEDSVAMHVRDTLVAGAGLCREDVVRAIVSEGPARIQELIALGTQFSERELPGAPGARELDLTKEGGHSKRRVLHAQDATGAEIERALLAAVSRQPNIEVFEDHLAIDPHHHAQAGGDRRQPLPGRVCARPPVRARGNVSRSRHAPGHRRLREGLPLHDQSGHRDR